MTADRERDVTAAFVGLATGLAGGDDVVDLLSRLTRDCTRLLDVASAGLLLSDVNGVLHVVAASSERTQDLESYQTQRHQGPCLDCFRSGRPVVVPDLTDAAARWPDFTAVALAKGFASVHAVPMRLRDRTVGALGLFGTTSGHLDPDDLDLGQALADVASVALLQNTRELTPSDISQQLATALNARVLVEQAKGVLAYTGDLTMDDAFARLTEYAVSEGRLLSVVAHQLVHGELLARDVLATLDSR